MSFGSLAALGVFERKPKENWVFNEISPYGTNANVGGIWGPGLILPPGISEEQRDLILWAWEAGRATGKHEGAQTLRRDLKRMLEIYG